MKTRLLAIACVAAFAALPASAASYLDPADGAWDCSSAGGVTLGRLDITEASYTFTRRDGTAGTPGELRQVEFHANPNFVVIGGYLSEIGIVAATVRELPVGIEYPLYLVYGDSKEGSCLRSR